MFSRRQYYTYFKDLRCRLHDVRYLGGQLWPHGGYLGEVAKLVKGFHRLRYQVRRSLASRAVKIADGGDNANSCRSVVGVQKWSNACTTLESAK